MSFKVVFLKDSHAVGVSPWADREQAIAYAKDHFPIRQRKLGATSVYVVEILTDKVVFRLPAREPVYPEQAN